jgi:signal transduction histidine kinase
MSPDEACISSLVVGSIRICISSILVLCGVLRFGALYSSIFSGLLLLFFYLCLWVSLAAARSLETEGGEGVENLKDRFYAAAIQQRASVQALAGEVRESLKAIETTVFHTSSLHPMNPALHMHHASVMRAVKTSIDNVKHLTDLVSSLHDVNPDAMGLKKMDWTPHMTEFDLPSVAENIADALSGVAEEKGVELVVSCPVERGRQHLYLVVGDKEMMTQIIFKVGRCDFRKRIENLQTELS